MQLLGKVSGNKKVYLDLDRNRIEVYKGSIKKQNFIVGFILDDDKKTIIDIDGYIMNLDVYLLLKGEGYEISDDIFKSTEVKEYEKKSKISN